MSGSYANVSEHLEKMIRHQRDQDETIEAMRSGWEADLIRSREELDASRRMNGLLTEFGDRDMLEGARCQSGVMAKTSKLLQSKALPKPSQPPKLKSTETIEY